MTKPNANASPTVPKYSTPELLGRSFVGYDALHVYGEDGCVVLKLRFVGLTTVENQNVANHVVHLFNTTGGSVRKQTIPRGEWGSEKSDCIIEVRNGETVIAARINKTHATDHRIELLISKVMASGFVPDEHSSVIERERRIYRQRRGIEVEIDPPQTGYVDVRRQPKFAGFVPK